MEAKMPRIHHPKLLAGVVLAVLLGGAVAAAVADNRGSDPDGGIVTLLPVEPAPTPNAEELAHAEAAARASGVVDRFLSGQTWQAAEPAFARVSGHAHAVAFRAKWADPVEARTTWLLLRCQGTRRYEPQVTWQGVTQLRVVVDIDTGEVLGLGVVAPLGRESNQSAESPIAVHLSGDTAVLRDLSTREVIASGSRDEVVKRAEQCPNGLSDD
jgi:hypothetical protein